MSFNPKLIAPERVGRAVVWVFVVLLGVAVITSIGFPGGPPTLGTPVPTPGVVEAGLAQGVAMLVDVVETTWREAVRDLTKVVLAVLDFQWWPLKVVMQWQDLGGDNVLHS